MSLGIVVKMEYDGIEGYLVGVLKVFNETCTAVGLQCRLETAFYIIYVLIKINAT